MEKRFAKDKYVNFGGLFHATRDDEDLQQILNDYDTIEPGMIFWNTRIAPEKVFIACQTNFVYFQQVSVTGSGKIPTSEFIKKILRKGNSR